jgi:hypothetical protein
MNNVINFKRAVSLVVGLSVVIWFGILFFKDQTATLPDAVRAIPTTAGYLTIILTFFISYAWRWKVFSGWLVLIPDLNGTWEGEFRSEWIDPKTNQKIGPKPAYLVIRQTLLETHCTQMTAESKSYSRAATILPTPDNNLRTLEFTYANSPKVSVQHRSQAHEGACCMEIIDSPSRKLCGKYWTERGTKGELEFKFLDKARRQQF